MIPLVRDTIRTRGFTRGHSVNGGREFVESERGLKKNKISGLKLRDGKRGEELVTGEWIKSEGREELIEVITNVTITKIIRRKRKTGRITERKQGGVLTRGIVTPF